MKQKDDEPPQGAWHQLRDELIVHIVFYGLFFLLGAVGLAYLALGVGVLLLLIPYAVIAGVAIAWWRRRARNQLRD